MAFVLEFLLQENSYGIAGDGVERFRTPLQRSDSCKTSAAADALCNPSRCARRELCCPACAR